MKTKITIIVGGCVAVVLIAGLIAAVLWGWEQHEAAVAAKIELATVKTKLDGAKSEKQLAVSQAVKVENVKSANKMQHLSSTISGLNRKVSTLEREKRGLRAQVDTLAGKLKNAERKQQQAAAQQAQRLQQARQVAGTAAARPKKTWDQKVNALHDSERKRLAKSRLESDIKALKVKVRIAEKGVKGAIAETNMLKKSKASARRKKPKLEALDKFYKKMFEQSKELKKQLAAKEKELANL